ncbi:hypothetical protein TrRE_jg507, partial [Triparma retinervis]
MTNFEDDWLVVDSDGQIVDDDYYNISETVKVSSDSSTNNIPINGLQDSICAPNNVPSIPNKSPSPSFPSKDASKAASRPKKPPTKSKNKSLPQSSGQTYSVGMEGATLDPIALLKMRMGGK